MNYSVTKRVSLANERIITVKKLKRICKSGERTSSVKWTSELSERTTELSERISIHNWTEGKWTIPSMN